MKVLIYVQLVALAVVSYGLFLPQRRIETLPAANTEPTNTPKFFVFVCGVTEKNVADFNCTWYTPSGVSIEATGTTRNEEGRFITQNVNVSILLLNYFSSLTVSELSYEDDGVFVCSAKYTLMDSESVIRTGNATINFQLIVEVTAVINSTTRTVGGSATLNCQMSRYLRPDADFLWRRGNQIISNDSRHSITYRDLVEDKGQLRVKTPSRGSSLTFSDLQLVDAGSYTCFVRDTDSSADVNLLVNPGPTEMPPAMSSFNTGSNSASTAKLTLNSTESAPGSFPIPVVSTIAAFLGIIVIVLIVLILLVSCYKRRKSATIVLEPPSRDLNDNTAYEPTNSSNHGERSFPSRPPPKYAVIDKHSISPAPPLPARPSTNLSMGTGNNSANSGLDHDRTPPGYDVPIHGNTQADRSHSITIDPYYDNPDDVRKSTAPMLPARNRSYYDEVELENGRSSLLDPKPDNSFNLMGVPSPAVVLSGTLQRNMGHPNPDFTYPPFSNGVQNDREHDYDQIYSEPIDPNIIRQDYEFESNESVPIPYSAIYEDPHPFQDSNAPLRVTHKNIVEIKELGMGQFGHVILAKTVGLSLRDLKLSETDSDPSKGILVAIKKLRTDADGCLMEAFDKEVKFMARLNHDNVIRLLAVCTSGESFIMMEYMENGDLNQFLTKQLLMPDTISGLQENEVTPIILLYIGVQIASGMHYLGSQRFVHRDLATRNCLVGRDFIVKISDFGMSRSLYESAYYRVQGTLVLPIRWMACETFYGKFSVKSDAWAFGVVLWEIYTLGKVDPYDHMTDEDVIADAIRGQDRLILEKPDSCPQDVYDIMQRCWVHEPSMRADFGEIYSRLFIIYTRQAL